MKRLFATAAAAVSLLALLCLGASAAENVAAGKEIATTYPTYSGTYPLGNIVDGNHSNVVGTSCMLSWTENGYIVVDLGDNYTVDALCLYNYQWPAQYCICDEWTYFISDDCVNFTEIATCRLPVDAASIPTGGYDGCKTGDRYDLPQSVEGRFIKLRIDHVYVGGTKLDKQNVRLYEFEVYGTLNHKDAAPAVTPAADPKPEVRPTEPDTPTAAAPEMTAPQTETPAPQTETQEEQTDETPDEGEDPAPGEKQPSDPAPAEEAPDAAPAPAEEAKTNVGMIVGIVAAAVVAAAAIVFALKKKK